MTDESKSTIEPGKMDKPLPWNVLFSLHSEFLNSLDCVYELFKQVTPVLEAKDRERKERVEELIEQMGHSDGVDSPHTNLLAHAKECVGHMRKMRQADTMFRQNIVVSIVSKFDEFLADLLRECYIANPNWLKNPNKTITYKDLFEAESVDRLRSELIQREVELLMRDSHHAQIAFIDDKIKIGLHAEFVGWHSFIEITERRNLYVHNGGCVNETYLSNSAKYGYSLPDRAGLGFMLPASDKYISNAFDCFYELSVRVVQGVVRRLYPAGLHDADAILNNPSVELLKQERWLLAENIFGYALSIPEKLISKNEYPYYWRINYCIALKYSGKSFEEPLSKVRWEAFHPMYHFAIAVLQDNFEEAVRLMQTAAVQEKILRESFLDWPLLRDFRETEAFQLAFEAVYGAPVQQEILKKAEDELKAEQEFEHAESYDTESSY
jgi:hypothetical protein